MGKIRLFEIGSDVTPLNTHRVASGLAGNTTKNHTWATIVTWLNTVLQLPAAQVTESTTLNFVTDAGKTQAEGTITTYVDIGIWDMDANATLAVAHGLSDYTKIRSVKAVIIPDGSPTSHTNLESINVATGAAQGGILSWDATNINLQRTTSGTFDSTAYDDGAINRGYLKIDSIP
jgi:hypothetical protein